MLIKIGRHHLIGGPNTRTISCSCTFWYSQADTIWGNKVENIKSKFLAHIQERREMREQIYEPEPKKLL